MTFNGKSVWITGASSGIGEALAGEFFARGARLIISARNVQKLEEIKKGFDAVESGRCIVVACDVTNSASINEAVNEVKKQIPKLDILVNNAGVSQRATALETGIDVVRQLFEVNFFGTIAITKAVLPWMIEKGGGHIAVISSMAGKFGFRMRSAYSAAKHALQGYFETLRAEMHDKNVRVTIICPGRVQTNISLNSFTGDGRLYGKMDKGQANGVSVTRCARIIAQAVSNNRKEVFIGGPELFLLVVKRACPALYYWIANRASPV